MSTSQEEDKIYSVVVVKPNSIEEFNEFWLREALPYWEQHGVKHIGSWRYLSGGPDDEIMRLFEFKNRKHYDEWTKWLMESEGGKALLDKLRPYTTKPGANMLNRTVKLPILLKKLVR
jgi:hypothetical protein